MASKKIIVGLLAGVAAGSLIAILCTTGKGSKIRKSIRNKSGDYVDDLKDSFSNFIDSVTGKYEGVKRDVINKAKSSWESR
jgi:gas vesicle protein